jgi:BirA family biotin operon repressor/biotin-[acetyl-CoA-carboxylase] ligase
MNRLGSPLLQYQSISSTNDLAREMAINGAEEGTTITAQSQTAGRGRQGRVWASPVGEGLYLSIILRPRIEPAQSASITLASAVAVAETLISDFHIHADIKWPNDILVGGRKICGILVESAIEGNQLQFLILGIGVNLAQTDFPEEISATATSILRESGLKVTPDEFLAPLLLRLDYWYRKAIVAPRDVLQRWEEMSSFARNLIVRIISSDREIEGRTCGLTETGALVIELYNGERREIVSGEVSLRQKSSGQ